MFFSSKSLKSIISIFLAGVLVGFFLRSPETFLKQNITSISPSPAIATASPSAELKSRVKRVIDGDTIELKNGQTVRYIGIDTPELHHPKKSVQCFGKEAMEENKKLIEGKEIILEKDVSETDRYKRLLRYIFLPGLTASDSPLFVNEYLVREGYAHTATFPPDVKYQKLFLEAEKQARSENKGLWKDCSTPSLGN